MKKGGKEEERGNIGGKEEGKRKGGKMKERRRRGKTEKEGGKNDWIRIWIWIRAQERTAVSTLVRE